MNATRKTKKHPVARHKGGFVCSDGGENGHGRAPRAWARHTPPLSMAERAIFFRFGLQPRSSLASTRNLIQKRAFELRSRHRPNQTHPGTTRIHPTPVRHAPSERGRPEATGGDRRRPEAGGDRRRPEATGGEARGKNPRFYSRRKKKKNAKRLPQQPARLSSSAPFNSPPTLGSRLTALPLSTSARSRLSKRAIRLPLVWTARPRVRLWP